MPANRSGGHGAADDEAEAPQPVQLQLASRQLRVLQCAPALLPLPCTAVFTGAFWVILRVLFGLMWLGILCGPLIM